MENTEPGHAGRDSPVTTISVGVDPEERQLVAQLAAARARVLEDLVGRGMQVEDVSDAFDRAARRFAEARVRSFVPILVERAVRAQFGHESAVAAETGASGKAV